MSLPSSLAVVSPPPAPALVPLPRALQVGTAAPFVLTADTIVSGDADAVAAAREVIRSRTGLTLSLGRADGTGSGIALRLDEGVPESYVLKASADGVSVVGADAAGLFYGVQTLGQLISRSADARDAAGGGWLIPAVRIEDAPRFAYRGVMLDVARHFFDVATVKAYIDRASSLKFNHLHLHLTDDQGWRLELASRPLLTERAAATAIGGAPGGFYTRDDYRELVAYAAAHHMTLVPEIDLPGHTHAVSLAYPEVSEQPVLGPQVIETIRDFGGGTPVSGEPYEGLAVGFSSLRITDEATDAFVRDVLGEIADLTPGPYLHIGGDEALGTPRADYDAFVGRVSRLIADLGKTPMAWHEAGTGTGLHPTTIGQYWGFTTPTDGMDDKARGFTALGSRLVMSPADAVYLDMKFDEDSPLGLTWANGVTSARRAYEWDPAEVIAGVSDDAILGVEAPLWTETARTLADLDALAFPRIAAAAEVAWSPAPHASALRTWESFAARVGAQAALWASLGIVFTPLPGIPWRADAMASDPAPAEERDA
ncbi:family 20 glycosylhydrolase [Microbacterium dextranolyticum]|uniref:beta-N-acetylhexosaminidase n=1 Tax=Microbacterium dextranolyticum TaxID=36806 RepID=A0A9W6M5U0_9MICO|nr:family 20 glycosylhydrolase [Microbacterium dextranolyticum]MBM7463839.1 hexosaminidase [Microbacterium dextranolyticum]GLJ94920.1 beta-N-acetylhexosaminidase [Microbacterium dextranolyticum]